MDIMLSFTLSFREEVKKNEKAVRLTAFFFFFFFWGGGALLIPQLTHPLSFAQFIGVSIDFTI